MSFKDISNLELWRPFCSAEQKHLCNFGRGHYEEQFCQFISNLGQWFRRRCRLKDFLSGALAAVVFSGAEPFTQFWKKTLWGTFIWSYMKFGLVVQEEMSFKEKGNGRTKTNHNTSPWAFGSGELKTVGGEDGSSKPPEPPLDMTPSYLDMEISNNPRNCPSDVWYILLTIVMSQIKKYRILPLVATVIYKKNYIEDLTWVLMFYWNYQTSWEKEIKCEAFWAFYLIFATSLINSIIQEHEC